MFTLIIEDKQGAIVDEYSFEDGEFIIGRSQQADIVLPADNVSRRHARLFTVDGRCYIEDLKAANGVWLNGKRIYNVTELPRSAQVRIGDFFLHIEGAAYNRPLGSAIYARLVPMPGSIGELTDLNQQTILIGRGKDCAVVLSDVSVSRIHAKITQQPDGRVIVEDLRSSNGTYVNDRRVDQQDLQHGDRIRFGTVAFSFQVDGMPEVDVSEPPPPAYAPPPQQRAAPRQVQPPVYASQYNAYAPLEHPPAPEMAYAPPQRSVLPQIAAVAVILVAVVALIILVGFAYDRLLAPRLDAQKQAQTAAVAPAVAPAPEQKAKPEAANSAAEKEKASTEAQVEELIARGQDAIARRQWDEAEALFRKAKKLDLLNPKSTEALNLINTEKRAGARFTQAEEAFARKDYRAAISQHRMIPPNSVYRGDADAALLAIAGVLEMDGDAACRTKNWNLCAEKYQDALSTGFAGPQVEQKYNRALKKQ